MDITLKKVIVEKEKTEKEITKLVNKFMLNTGLRVTGIKLHFLTSYNNYPELQKLGLLEKAARLQIKI